MPSAGRSAELTLRIVADTRAAASQVGAVQGKVGGLAGMMPAIGGAIAAGFAVGAVVDWGAAVVGQASDAEQAAGAVESVFGDAADQVLALGERAAESTGLAAAEYDQLAAVLGAQLETRGIDDVVGTTDQLIGMGADLAATFGGTTADAVSALGGALRGEFDPLEKYGTALTAAAVNAKAVEMGLATSTDKVTAQAKAQATLALITEQSADAQGAFAKESDTLAGSSAILGAKWQNVTTQLGNVLIPVIAKVVTWLSDLIDLVVTNTPKIWNTIQPGVKLIVAVFKLWFNVVSMVVKNILSVLGGLINFVKAVFKGDWQAAWDAIAGIFTGIYDNISEMLGNIPEILGDIVPGLGAAALDAGEAIVTGILDGLGAAGGAVADFATSVGNAFKDFINEHVIGPIKNFSFTIDVLAFHKTFQPFGSLPYLAKGGIVTGPTLAMIGERGPEAVVPLRRGGMGPTFNVTVQAGVGDPVRIGQSVVEAITAYERVNGRRWRSTGVV